MLITIIEVDNNVVYATLETNDGGRLTVLAEVASDRRVLHVRDFHVHGDGANSLGPAVLRRMVHEVMEDLDVDAIVVGGARRTTGAGPGRTPRQLRFTRHRPPDE